MLATVVNGVAGDRLRLRGLHLRGDPADQVLDLHRGLVGQGGRRGRDGAERPRGRGSGLSTGASSTRWSRRGSGRARPTAVTAAAAPSTVTDSAAPTGCGRTRSPDRRRGSRRQGAGSGNGRCTGGGVPGGTERRACERRSSAPSNSGAAAGRGLGGGHGGGTPASASGRRAEQARTAGRRASGGRAPRAGNGLPAGAVPGDRDRSRRAVARTSPPARPAARCFARCMNGSFEPRACATAAGLRRARVHPLAEGAPGGVPAGGERGAGRAHRPTQLSTDRETVTAP